MSTLAAFLVLGGGTALASYVISSNSQVGPDTISGHNPPSGDHVNVINGSLDTADLAAGAVTTGKIGSSAVTDGKLAAGSVDTPKFAPGATAPNASHLWGLPATAFQRRVTGVCTKGRAIRSIKQDGTVGCAAPVVMPIAADPTPTSQTATDLRPSNLGLIEICGPSSIVEFVNNGNQAGTLNWMFSEGGTTSTVNATGNVIAPFPSHIDFIYNNRLEGQWIFAGGGAETTVNLHAFNGGSSCEVRGTAEWAPNP